MNLRGSVAGRVWLARYVTTERMTRKARKEADCEGKWSQLGRLQATFCELTWIERPARRISLACFVVTLEGALPRTFEDSDTPMRAAPVIWMMVVTTSAAMKMETKMRGEKERRAWP